MRKLFLITSILFISNFVIAQKNFRSGYVIQNGDTLKGLIKNQRPKINSQVCNFKTSKDSKPVSFTASEISGYGFDEGIHYKSFLLKETSSTLSDKKMIPKRYFLNVLVSGKADLFFAYDIAGKGRFFIKNDTIFRELEIKENIIKNEKDGRYYNEKSKLYLGLLTYLFKDCPSINPAINKTALKRISLINTFSAYNKCIHPDSLYYVQKIKRSVTTFGASYGMNYTFIKFFPQWRTSELNADYNNTPGFAAGIVMNNTLPFINERLSLNSELFYTRTNFKAKYSYRRFYDFVELGGQQAASFDDYTLNSDIELNTIKLPLQVRYTFGSSKFRPYFNGGIIYNYDLSIKEKGSLSLDSQNNPLSKPVSGYFNTRFYIGIIGGIGFQWQINKNKSAFLDLKYLPENIISLYGFESKAQTTSLNVGLTF